MLATSKKRLFFWISGICWSHHSVWVSIMDLIYFEIPELPGRKYFECTRCSGNFSVQSCAKMWRMANSKRRIEAHGQCRGCQIGAMHAGEGDGQWSKIYGLDLCARCLRVGMRLIHGDLCVSCWNREREVIVGCNARGRIPMNHPPIAHRRITVVTDGKQITVDRPHSVTVTELIIAALRDNPKRVLFGFHGSVLREDGRVGS